MEKVKQPFEGEELEAPLRGGRSRQHGHITTTLTTTTATNATQYFDGKSTDTSNVGAEPSSKDCIGKPESEICFDKNKSNRETENLPDETNVRVPTSAEPPKEKISLAPAVSSNLFDLKTAETGKISHGGIQEIKADVTEICLEEVFKKPETREFYCPNCEVCIKKVILRDAAEPEISPAQSTEELRCSYCLSFLIPAGSWLFPNWFPSGNGEESVPEQVHDPLGNKDPSSGTLLEQHPAPASRTDEAPPSAKPVGVYPSETQQPKMDSIAAPKPDSDSTVDVVVDSRTPLDATPEQDTEISPDTLTAHDSTETATINGSREDNKVEILKSIVYGGLTESITSLSVVTSAASAGATTLNIVAVAFANLIGGLFILGHNLWDLKGERPQKASNQGNEQVDRYQELLGQKKNFVLHSAVVVLSYLAFGLVPPVVYGFSFNDNGKDFKLLAVAAASLTCIAVLAIGKAHIRNPPPEYCGYFVTVMNYVFIGVMASGISYAAGNLTKEVIEKFGWLESGFRVVVDSSLSNTSSWKPALASY